jgi:hypothetical protein
VLKGRSLGKEKIILLLRNKNLIKKKYKFCRAIKVEIRRDRGFVKK